MHNEIGDKLDPRLRDFCVTDHQRMVFDTIFDTGNISKAARRLDIKRAAAANILTKLRRRAAKQGYSPDHDMTRPVPDGFHVRGVSTYYNKEGQPAGQWVKSNLDHERQMEMLREAISAMSEEIKPAVPVTVSKRRYGVELLSLYVITDYHIGMLAWDEETRGDNWDTEIAEDLLVAWFSAAIEATPDSKTGIFCQLGDFLHWDGLDALTPANKNVLDADTRYQRLVRVAIRALRRVIALLLKKHEHVHLIMAEGNHDPVGSIWLREWLTVLYEKEPRITVDNSADPYYCYEHGDTSLFFHHGHKRKVTNIDDVFVAKFREIFGRTKHSYGHMGHLHHRHQIETNLMVVEQHRTLAAPDAYASRGGWLSGREAQAITYHKRYGEVGRVVINPDAVRG